MNRFAANFPEDFEERIDAMTDAADARQPWGDPLETNLMENMPDLPREIPRCPCAERGYKACPLHGTALEACRLHRGNDEAR